MFTKIRTTMLALAAVASLGLASLVATTDSADARGFGGGGMSRGGGGGHIGMRMGGGGRHMGGHNLGGGRHIGGLRHGGFRRFHVGHRYPNWCRWSHRCNFHVRWQRPWIYGAGVVATTYAVAPTVAAAPRPCTCLTKEYTPDNLVVFKDVCTKEVASAPIGNTQAQLPAPTQQ